jgi:hypothetical protein
MAAVLVFLSANVLRVLGTEPVVNFRDDNGMRRQYDAAFGAAVDRIHCRWGNEARIEPWPPWPKSLTKGLRFVKTATFVR